MDLKSRALILTAACSRFTCCTCRLNYFYFGLYDKNDTSEIKRKENSLRMIQEDGFALYVRVCMCVQQIVTRPKRI